MYYLGWLIFKILLSNSSLGPISFEENGIYQRGDLKWKCSRKAEERFPPPSEYFLFATYFLNLFLIGRWLHYNIVLVSAIHQHESTVSTYVPSPLPTSSHPSRLSQSTRFELTANNNKFPRDISFTYGNVYASVLLYQFISSSPSPTVSISLFSIPASPLLPCK